MSGLVQGGIREICIGVEDIDAAIAYWRCFGYAPVQRGGLEAAQSLALYGVDQPLDAVRLGHGTARNGLVRLWRWPEPLSPGLSMARLRTPGNRWSVHKSDDLLRVWTHALVHQRQGRPIALRGPVINAHLKVPEAEQPTFRDAVPCALNLQIFTPEYQTVVMQRLHVDVGRYGTCDPGSLFQASEGCHMAIVVYTDDLSMFDFYDGVLGLKRQKARRLGHNPGNIASDMFDLEPGEFFTEIDFDDPESGDSTATHLPGRLRVFAVEAPMRDPDMTAQSQPGHLGYTLYSLATADIAAAHARLADHQATPVLTDEFGRPSFAFTSPDGYRWQMTAD